MQYQNDPYSILGLSKDASVEEVKIAYRRIARRLHPDVNPNNPGAAAQFQEITRSYEILMNAEQKRAYDVNANAKNSNKLFKFSLRVTPSKRAITALQEQQVVYLLAEILPDPLFRQGQQVRQSKINLALVLDKSNSMNGTRLDRVKVATHQIIDQLSEGDIFSVITFNDRAEVIINAGPVDNKPALKAKISMMTASGGTEIYKGLSAGIEQVRRYLGPKLVNHVILLTDGHTFGDQVQCTDLAREAAKQGISISALGLGQEWNDEFLDELASITGGSSAYINSANAVVKFLNDHVRNLSNAFSERMRLSIAPDPDVKLESVFRLSPNPQPLSTNEGNIQLGSLQTNRLISVLMQFQMPVKMSLGFRSIARLVVSGDIFANQPQYFQALSDISLEITERPIQEDPPSSILDALGKLTLYRMQERAQAALASGDVKEATQRLEHLATRLLALGQGELANQARAEARHAAHTNNLSDKGKKNLKYQTRLLLAQSNMDGNE
ncbi:MAG: VWA domain-containing protein [Anaerolineae bacterium]|nr:VWA domain-containing protein [Anaerolineae bacterium]